MKVSDQVCSLEQAKRLKELGVRQEGLFCFIGDENPDPRYNEPMRLFYESEAIECGKSWYDNRIAAFTVAELGIMLPDYYFAYKRPFGYALYKNEDGGFAVADGTVNGATLDTMAECIANGIIYMIENNLITVDEINARI